MKSSGEDRLPFREQAVRQERLGHCAVLVKDSPLDPVGSDWPAKGLSFRVSGEALWYAVS